MSEIKTANEVQSNRSVSRLLGLMRPWRGRVILSVVLSFLQVACFSLAPLYMGWSIDAMGKILGHDVTGDRAISFVTGLILMCAAYLLSSVFSYLASLLMTSAGENAVKKLRGDVSRKLSRLPLNYYDTHSYGDILSRVTNDINTVSASLQQTLTQVINAVFTVIVLLYTMLSINGILTAVGLAVIPVALFLASRIAGKSQKEIDRQQQLTGEINGYVEEYYAGHNVVTVCGREATVTAGFEEKNEELYDAGRKGMFLADVLSPVIQNTTNLGYTLVCLCGALMAIAGGLSIGMIQAFTQYLTQFSSSVTQALSVTGIIQTIRAASTRVFEFLDEEEETQDPEPGAFPAELKGRMEFDHVRFGYQPHRTLIHDLCVKVNPGEKTAIVGPTGCGKTTLINLIMRFYDVKGGAIRIDGVDSRDMKRERLREIFSMVLQDTWLYNGTIMENIRYGRLDATDEEVIRAAEQAHADAFIRTLPGGYQFVLQEGAGNIAQGQRQLLTIARAMLSKAPIMILDEATSSVDTRTEVLIQQAMAEMMKGRTSFVIAHRLSTIRDADRIMYMQDGDIMEMGTHDELMAQNGLYASLYRSQFADRAE
ncbi:MAG: ABC transporter ATP-binding protein [Clostridia bacterium]|nr:ABC transporter ATP-binding protein [Clostridia bacterium]